MATVEPPLDDGHLEDAVAYEYHRRGVNTRLIIGIGVFAVMSLYLSLVAVSRVDGVLFPGNELGLPGGWRTSSPASSRPATRPPPRRSTSGSTSS